MDTFDGPTPPAAHNPAVEELIIQMTSEFSPAHPDGYWGADMYGVPGQLDIQPGETPQSRNWNRIDKARNTLTSIGITAFPDLVAHSKDLAYSYSLVSAAWRNWSVGDACFFIIENQVDFWGYGYKTRDAAAGRTLDKPRYLWTVRRNPGMDQWWQIHQRQSLRELQIESLEWSIQQESNAGFTDDNQRHQVLDPLERRLAELRTAK